MQTYSFSSGNPPERERRLCRQQQPAPGGKDFEQALKAAGEVVESFTQWVLERFRDIIGTNEETRRRLRDEQRWIEAFSDPKIFITDRADPNYVAQNNRGVQGHPFGPRELLLSLTPQDRHVEYMRFLREMIPPSVRDVFEQFDAPGFAGNRNLDEYVKAAGAGGEPVEVPSFQRDILQYVPKILIGEDIRPSAPEYPNVMIAQEIARATLRHIYLLRDARTGAVTQAPRLYNDYREAVRALGLPTGVERVDPTLLINRLGPSRLKAALRLGLFNRTDLEALDKRLREEEAGRAAQAQKTREGWEKVDKSVRRDIERRNRTFMDNWDDMGGGERLLAIGIAVAALTGFFGKFAKNLARGTALTLAGVYFYRRLVMGDDAPLDAMSRGISHVVDLGINPIRRGMERAGLAAPAHEAQHLNVMLKALDEQGIEPERVAVGYAGLAEVRLQILAPTVNVHTNADGTFGGTLDLKPGGNLEHELRGIARRRNYDAVLLLKAIRDNQGQIAGGILHSIFYQLAAHERPDAADALDKRRRQERAPGFNRGASMGVRDGYLALVQRGKELATTVYGDKTFIEIIRMFSQPERRQARGMDNAERIENPLAHRPAEREMYEGLRSPTQARIDAAFKRTVEAFPGIINSEEFRKLLVSAAGGPAAAAGLVAAIAAGPNALLTAAPTFMPRLAQNPSAALTFLLLAEGAESLKQLQDSGVVTPDAAQLLMRFVLARAGVGRLTEALTGLQQAKYALLLAANKSDRLPLGHADVQNLIAVMNQSTVANIAENVLSWVNQYLGVSSNFGRILSLANVETILRERTFAGVRSLNDQGFQVLQKNVARYRALFTTLRSRDVNNPALVTAVGSNEAEARRLLTQLNALPDFNEQVDRTEQYFAQRCANSLVLAMLVMHRSDGRHTIDRNPDQRFITPTEEANLVREFDLLFREIVGTVVEPSPQQTVPAQPLISQPGRPLLQPQPNQPPTTFIPQPNVPVTLQPQQLGQPVLIVPQPNNTVQILPQGAPAANPLLVSQPAPNAPPAVIQPQPNQPVQIQPQPGQGSIHLIPQPDGSIQILPQPGVQPPIQPQP